MRQVISALLMKSNPLGSDLVFAEEILYKAVVIVGWQGKFLQNSNGSKVGFYGTDQSQSQNQWIIYPSNNDNGCVMLKSLFDFRNLEVTELGIAQIADKSNPATEKFKPYRVWNDRPMSYSLISVKAKQSLYNIETGLAYCHSDERHPEKSEF